jgi:hypothetical protein
MKQKKISFTIFNDTQRGIILIHEPECFEFTLPPNEEVVIEADCCEHSIVLKQSIADSQHLISILDENSLYNVLYKGVDVFNKFK